MTVRMSTTVLLGVGILACVIGSVQAEVVIETVPVGNPGNPGEYYRDWDISYGGVGYEHNIGKYEVTAGQYTEFLNAVASNDPYGLYDTDMPFGDSGYGCRIERYGSSGSYTYSVADNWANRPVNYVSWGDAGRFSNWLHNDQPTGELTGDPAQDAWLTENGAYFLDGATTDAALLAIDREDDWKWAITSEDEWYKAAYHKNDGVTDNYFDYPTSSVNMPGYVNNSGSLSGTGNPFTEGGADPGNYATYDGDGGINGIGASYYRTEVGEWENSGSPYGTFDQGGNVWEWNEATRSGSFRGLRGGCFAYSYEGLLAAHRDIFVPPTAEEHNYGFRLAQVPEPTTLMVLAIGAIGILGKRRQ